MRPLSKVQAFAGRTLRYGMRMRVALIFLFLLVFGPGYSGPAKLSLFGPHPDLRTERVPAPKQVRTGHLTWLGGVKLRSNDPAFGGFSALSLAHGKLRLLSDGGNFVSFRLDRSGQPSGVEFAELPGGPRKGWSKRDRDSESMMVGPDGRVWVGFENANQIWRYTPGLVRAERAVRPWAMRNWDANGGAEALARLADGRFVVLAEEAKWPGRPGRAAILFTGDPTIRPRAGFGFSYLPASGFSPSDVAVLPSGDLLILEREWRLPIRFRHRLVRVPRSALRPGALVRRQEIARIESPLPTENYEGLAVVRDGNRTIIWLVSDNDQMPWRPTYLLKFRLD